MKEFNAGGLKRYYFHNCSFVLIKMIDRDGDVLESNNGVDLKNREDGR